MEAIVPAAGRNNAKLTSGEVNILSGKSYAVFQQHLPTHREVRKEIGRFLPKSVIEGMREVFLYHGSDENYQEMLASCESSRFKKKANQAAQTTPGLRPSVSD